MPRRTQGTDGAPIGERDKKFCQQYLKHFDARRAYDEAGFKGHGDSRMHMATVKLQKFARYLQPRMDAIHRKNAVILAEKMSIGQEDILRGMARIAFPKIEEYLLKVPAIREVKEDGKLTGRFEPVMGPDGKPVYRTVLKPLHELTSEQLQCVEIYNDMGGRPVYKFSTLMVRHKYLESLGKQSGLFVEKLILERHQQSHEQAVTQLKNASTEQLTDAMKALMPLASPEVLQQLGISKEEYAAVIDGEFTEK